LFTQHAALFPRPLPSQDWRDIDMAIETGVDFISLSFVKSADTVRNLKS
jgi:pyruvate kinase